MGRDREKDLELLHYADTPTEAFEQLRDAPDRASPRARPSRKPPRRASRRRAGRTAEREGFSQSVSSYCVTAWASAIVAQPVAHALIH